MNTLRMEQLHDRDLMAANVLEAAVENDDSSSDAVETPTFNFGTIGFHPTKPNQQNSDTVPMDSIALNFSKVEFPPATNQEAVDNALTSDMDFWDWRG